MSGPDHRVFGYSYGGENTVWDWVGFVIALIVLAGMTLATMLGVTCKGC